jgi:membrane-bound acyltransferase YfiQ involved in biofilm formation
LSKHIFKELFLLRGIACLAVVVIHSISSVFANFGIRKAPEYLEINYVLFVIQILLMFGTPMFVFISEFILANSYKNEIPKGFFAKRFKYIFIPYIVIGTLSSIIIILPHGNLSFNLVLDTFYKQFLLGYFHGYFVLIIFQFYFLHFIFNKYIVRNIKSKFVITISLLINFAYLWYFNFIDPSPSFPFHLLFLAWIGYFSFAYYCGRNINKFHFLLHKHRKIILLSTAITSFIVLTLCYSGTLTYIQSKRIDILFYTIALAFSLYYVGMRLKTIPGSIVKISKYSFGIYLLHPFFLMIIEELISDSYSIISLVIYVIVAITVGVLGPIICIYFLNKLKWGPYIIGKIGIGISTKKQSSSTATKTFSMKELYK